MTVSYPHVWCALWAGALSPALLLAACRNVWDAGGAGTQLGAAASQQPGLDAVACLAVLDNSAARAAVSPSGAASRVLALGLECVRQLLQWPDLVQPEHRGTLQALLLAFSDQAGAESGKGLLTDEELLKACKQFYVYFSKQTALTHDGKASEAGVVPSFLHHHTLLLILDATCSVAVVLQGSSASGRLKTMRGRTSKAADEMLKMSWADGDVSAWQEGRRSCPGSCTGSRSGISVQQCTAPSTWWGRGHAECAAA